VRIGIIHSYYRSEFPSGENHTVNDIGKILADIGHEVSIWSFDSDSVVHSRKARIKQAIEILCQRKNKNEFEKWLEVQDIIQIHNYFPGMTYSNLKSLLKSGIKINRVIHNYRKTCIQGNHFRLNTLCHKCNLSRRLPGIIRGCYNKSLLSSLFVSRFSKRIETFESAVEIDYIAISETISKYLESIGIDQNKIHLIPNSVSAATSISIKATDCVFFGRIEAEKGIFQLLDVWMFNSQLPTLHVIGSGTKLREVRRMAAPLKNVIIHGAKYGDELEKILHNSKVAIFPALWEEPFGRTLVESLARGQAIAASTNFSQLNAFSEGINGSSFAMEGTECLQAIQKCLNLKIENQIERSQNIWKESFSPAAVSKFWEHYYSEKMYR